jgi:hypothetical protein
VWNTKTMQKIITGDETWYSIWYWKQITKLALETADTPHDPRKLTHQKSQMKAMFITFFDIKGTVALNHSTRPNSQPSLCGNSEAVTWDCA